jgi:hypothetical protein
LKSHALIAAGILLVASRVIAGPADYVYQPRVEVGERELDLKFGTTGDSPNARQSAASVGVGYGATEWWFTEFYVKYKREDGQGTKFDAIEWENKFQLTETGKYPVDLGVLVEVERPQDRAEGWEVKLGPLFQTEFGKLQANFNPLLQRSYRIEGPSRTQFMYQWQAKYRWQKQLEPGLQGFGEMGQWNTWAPREEQNHRAGPALFGKISLGGRSALQYNVAWLFGLSRAAPDHTLRVQTEFEF